MDKDAAERMSEADKVHARNGGAYGAYHAAPHAGLPNLRTASEKPNSRVSLVRDAASVQT